MSKARSKARHIALQALYQWEIAGQDLGDIEAQHLGDSQSAGAEIEYFKELLHQIPKQLAELDAAIEPHLSRPLKQVDPIERAILRIGAYELKNRLDVPYRVVINEGVELAKTFGADQGHKFVNGVLDKVAKSTRAIEVANAKRR